ncbi:hypothetical protein GCM10023185_39090 [Hymenobacter saemangeumensis]|uniref:TFIIB-type zinc ribbon-containing protein n=1 Tax=Hymenobacter saemangeumensis TaxID=1084522 RepID=A0ABP8IQR8_9BACT
MTTDVALRELREAELLRAPCPGCGAQLTFRAETQGLGCTHCAATQALAFSRDKLQENSLAGRHINGELSPGTVAEQQLFCCAGCGARTRVSADRPTLSCGFCGGRVINPEAQRTRLIEPAGVLPFQLSREQATTLFQRWVGSSLLAPGDLKSGAVLDNLHGIYLPFWTFDAQAHSEWSGERGTYYYVTVSGTDSQGRRVTQQEQRTRWSFHRGSHQQFYDDVLTLASRSLSKQQKHADAVLHYDLKAVVDYDPRVLLGWEAEVYAIDLAEGLERGRATIRQREEEACARLLGGDTQRDLQVDTTLTAESFKHLLLPLWLCAYVYRGKVYHFLVNGQTGRVSGSQPVSVWKVLLLGLLVFVLAGLLLYFQDQKR